MVRPAPVKFVFSTSCSIFIMLEDMHKKSKLQIAFEYFFFFYQNHEELQADEKKIALEKACSSDLGATIGRSQVPYSVPS